MTNSHTIMQRVDACNQWQPIRVPRRGDDREMFHVFMLLPAPVELMQAVVARAEAVEPTINAFTYKYFDEAMDAARASEARWAKGAPLGCLDGLPVGIKDESYIAGKPTSNGSLIKIGRAHV